MTENREGLKRILNFIIEIDKLKNVTRKVKPLSNARYENSAEHSWHIAMLALSLSSYVDGEVDMDHVIRMLLVHDIGEIGIGDTMFFVEGGWKERKEDELNAAKAIFSMAPEHVYEELLSLWKEFEEGETVNAQFANAIDRAMPVLLNLNNNGQSWKENQITYQRVIEKIEPPIRKGFPLLWDYLEEQLAQAEDKGYFHK